MFKQRALFTKIGKKQYEVELSPKAKTFGARNYLDSICGQLRLLNVDVLKRNEKIRLMGMDLKVEVDDENEFLTILEFLEEGELGSVDISIYDFCKPRYS